MAKRFCVVFFVLVRLSNSPSVMLPFWKQKWVWSSRVPLFLPRVPIFFTMTGIELSMLVRMRRALT